MNKNLLFLVGIILASLTLSCGKNDNNTNDNSPVNQQNVQPTPDKPFEEKGDNLIGRTFAEVLDKKYSKAELSCSLWVQRNEKLDLSVLPTDAFVLDLKQSGLSQTFSFALSGQVQDNEFDVIIKIDLLSIGSFDCSHDNFHYKAQYSPYAKYSLSFVSKYKDPVLGGKWKVTGDGSSGLLTPAGSTANSCKEHFTINENFADTFYRVSDLVSNSEDERSSIITWYFDSNEMLYRHYVQCVINTEIKPEYQDQFEILHKNL